MIVKPVSITSLLATLLLFCSFAADARDCNIGAPSFQVDGKEQWGKSAEEIFDKASKTPLAKGRKGSTEGIQLKSLLTPFTTKGTLAVYTCGKKTLNFEVKDLLSDDKTKSDYALILARKGFFKIVTEDGSKPVLKKINQIKLTTGSE